RRGDRPLLPGGEGRLGALVRAGRRRPPPLGCPHRPEAAHAPHAVALALGAPLRSQAPRAAVGEMKTSSKRRRAACARYRITYPGLSFPCHATRETVMLM